MTHGLSDRVIFRPARKNECRTIALLYRISSDGVADYIWTTLARAGEDILDIGEKRYMREDTQFSYKNCVIAESGGRVAGMIAAFPMLEPDENVSHTDIDPVLAPYSRLEQYNSYYIAGMAVYPEYRGKGIGTKFLEIAAEKALSLRLPRLSLIVFEGNERAKRLYERHGFYEIMRERVVPHELIHHTGDALLMVKHIK